MVILDRGNIFQGAEFLGPSTKFQEISFGEMRAAVQVKKKFVFTSVFWISRYFFYYYLIRSLLLLYKVARCAKFIEFNLILQFAIPANDDLSEKLKFSSI